MAYSSLKDINDRRQVLLKLNAATGEHLFNTVHTTVDEVKGNALKWIVPTAIAGLVTYLGKRFIDKTDIFEKKETAPRNKSTKEMLESVREQYPDLSNIVDNYMPK